MTQNQQTPSGYGDCPVCHGTGWELYTATVLTYGEPEEAMFARRCTRCTGARRSEDNTGVPAEYHDADFMKFDFAAYRIDMSKLKTLCTDILKNFDRWNKAGKGLYLWSKTPGSGKIGRASCRERV